ncbi:hypothetical protein PA598K_01378 [Paenibacillus sp. 598K]|uniref:helix-turn-helix domain-containing protein n=1 Tax=Paenibacillus sp. 598K TaxID=1117987 RepID=UPI000FFA2DD6|nr:helix-turn-helix transcriptional regulator [Paenibacillus sp. 598K]GBF73093.1 hypothetical protein PA598K_01378 [Paenibacillus sp. 598K]
MRYTPDRCRLIELYEETKISQRELSLLSGISESQLSDYAHNRKVMGLGVARTIVRCLRLDCIDQLYTWRKLD